MNVVMILVASVNGKTTHASETNIYTWTSKEDQHLFFSLRDAYPLIVMGRKTYEAARDKMEFPSGKKRIVLTHKPEKYKDRVIPGKLEFTDESPKELMQRLTKEGHQGLLLVGGMEIDAAFLQAGLVDELHLTIEPVLFGQGKNILPEIPFQTSLTLKKVQQLNPQGTLHIIYTVRHTTQSQSAL